MLANRERVYIYDTTLRDGAQTFGVDFSVDEKITIAQGLAALGVDFIEGGWPGANPTDTAFFKRLADVDPDTTQRLVAFGKTAALKKNAADDAGLMEVIASPAPHVCLVAKAWDYQVTVALGGTLEENLTSITASFALAKEHGKQTLMCDLEHFFDGYKANPAYALACAEAAVAGGATWLVMCDTNGGTLPPEISDIVPAVVRAICGKFPKCQLGIHTHNDAECAVANSLLAVAAGARQVQGTLTGLGERCGNASLTSTIPTLLLKPFFRDRFRTEMVDEALPKLGELSKKIDAMLNRPSNPAQAYFGANAFVTKAGLHASAILKDPRTYEHVPPESVGNARKIIMADQGGRSNTLAALKHLGFDLDPRDERVVALTDEIKRLTEYGYAFDQAEASLLLLAKRRLQHVPDFFKLLSYDTGHAKGHHLGADLAGNLVEAWVKMSVRHTPYEGQAVAASSAEALMLAMKAALPPFADKLRDVTIADMSLRQLTLGGETTHRIILTLRAGARTFKTLGAGINPTEAECEALRDGLVCVLMGA
ncbi:MAG: citramalate synthase [Alphaproteobacteria bacterium]|nr:citramalate synthase [Alphaproteobacteria bacterium]